MLNLRLLVHTGYNVTFLEIYEVGTATLSLSFMPFV